MKTKLNVFVALLMALCVHISFAQEKTVTGSVSDASGPLPGVTVIVKGTNTGTQTDFDGNYSIKATTGAVLQFSFIGMKDVEKTVGSSGTMNVAMQESAEALQEVVVTAQGIRREKKALGYAISEVQSEELEQRTEGDVARVLSGKASGVQITSQSGTSGSATSVVIRGYSSITGSNQALFIVDGVPFSSDTNAQGGFLSGNVGSSRFLDLDPNNIESVNVLKGLAAATLYGTAGRNGVIVITTKSGTAKEAPKKTEITVNQSYFVNEIASVPDYQDTYGGGFDQSFGWFFSNWGPGFAADGVDGYMNDPAQKIAADGTVEHPYSSSAFLNNFNGGNNQLLNEYSGTRYEWKPYNSVERFFRSGDISNTSINVRGGNADLSYNVNYSHLDEKGFTPGNGLKRNAISVGGRAKLSNKFSVNATLNFASTDMKSPPVAASRGNGGISGTSVFGHVFFTPRNVDLMGLPYTIPENGGSIYYRNGNDIINPRWIVENSSMKQLTNRVYGTATISYEINDNLNISYRGGIDWYNERNTEYSNKNGVEFDTNVYGYLQTWDNNVRINNNYIALSGDYEFDDFGLTFIAGANSMGRTYEQQGVSSSGQIVMGVQRHFNYEKQTPIQYGSRKNEAGILAEAALDYRDYAFLTLSGRKDWISNMPKENNSLFYPSASISFLPTAAFEEMKSDALSYLKLRASIGQSAGFPSGYPSVNTVDQYTQQSGGAAGDIVQNTVSNFKANPDLKPELISEIEFGFDARMWDNRIDLGVSYYDKATTDMIVYKPLSPASGYTQTQDNIGKVEGSGWEIDLGVDLVRTDEINWNSRMNFTTSEQIVTEQEDDQIIFGGSSAGWLGGNAAIKGEQLGVMVGTAIARDANGNYLVNSLGSYKTAENIVLPDGRSITPIIGNPNPDYVMNFINSLSYKNFNLGFQISHTKGGDIASTTVATLLGRGLITATENRKNTFILPGINENTGQANQVQINNSQYYFSNVLFGPKELTVYDGSVIRLQEVSLGYTFPDSYLDKTPFGSLSITASGYNLWYDAYNMPESANFDPNVAGAGVGNSRGWDYMNGPSSKRWGISLKASF